MRARIGAETVRLDVLSGPGLVEEVEDLDQTSKRKSSSLAKKDGTNETFNEIRKYIKDGYGDGPKLQQIRDLTPKSGRKCRPDGVRFRPRIRRRNGIEPPSQSSRVTGDSHDHDRDIKRTLAMAHRQFEEAMKSTNLRFPNIRFLTPFAAPKARRTRPTLSTPR
ncbi:MAG: hypothetical protein IPL32_18815 [Chloracidobacterium sp.]|nr:hypothetical protein [Chloracidobacterium sp.]